MRTSFLSLFALASLALVAPSQAVSVPPSEDSSVAQGGPTYNYGGYNFLQVFGTSGANRIAYIRFSDSCLKSNLFSTVAADDVAHAVLRVYVNAVTTSASFNVYQVTSSWTEGVLSGTAGAGVTYSTKPTDASTSGLWVNVPGLTNSNYVSVDITAIVRLWLANPTLNYGLVLKAGETATTMNLESKEGAHPPVLDVTLVTRRVLPTGDLGMGSFTAGAQP